MRRPLLLVLAILLVPAAPASAGPHSSFVGIAPADGDNVAPVTRTIEVLGEPGLVTDVDVTLFDVTHTNPDDLDIALRSPNGTTAFLMSDRCGTTDVAGVDWTFDDEAATAIPPGDSCTSNATYQPEEIDGDAWTIQTDGDDLSLFDGENPLGDWRLYVVDDAGNGFTGQILGFRIDIETGGAEIQIPGGTKDLGAASPYPAPTQITSGGVLTDVDVVLDGLTHSYPDDLEMVLEGPLGQRVALFADNCDDPDFVDLDFDIDDEAPAELANTATCPAGTYKPTAQQGGDITLPAPAPGAPYGTSLSEFDLTDPDGTWKLWAADDEGGDAGFMIGGYDLQLTTRPGATVDPGPDLNVPEGGTARVTITRGGSDPLGAGTVRVRTEDGTAVAGADYTPVDQVLGFAAGETSKTIEVPIAADGAGEPAQAFTVALSAADADASVGSRAAATITVPADAVTPPPPPPPPPPAFNAANATSFPSARRCRRRGARLRFRAKAPAGVTLARTELFVNGKRVRNLTGAKADDVIRVKVRRKRTRVQMKVTAADGRVLSRTRTYKRCKPRRRRG